MSNSPQENLTPSSANDSKEAVADEGSAVEGLVEDVLRDARSLLGEPAATETDEDEAAQGEDRSGEDAEAILGDLERLSEDLAAEVEASPIGMPPEAGLHADGIKRGPAARDLGPEGPQVDLFGMASSSEAPMAKAEETHGMSATPEPAPSDTGGDAPSPAAALEALMEHRIAQESKAGDSSPSIQDASPSSPTSGITEAEAVERAAVASLDAMGGGTPLRSTAGEVDAVSSGDPIVRTTTDAAASRTSAAESVSNESAGSTESDSGPSEVIEEPESPPACGSPPESPEAPIEVGSRTISVDSPSEDGSTTSVESRAEADVSEHPSTIARITAMPFRLLPSSMHGLVSVAAVSLVFWIPVAWTYAILGPEGFERFLPSAAAPVGGSEPVLSNDVIETEADPADPEPGS